MVSGSHADTAEQSVVVQQTSSAYGIATLSLMICEGGIDCLIMDWKCSVRRSDGRMGKSGGHREEIGGGGEEAGTHTHT